MISRRGFSELTVRSKTEAYRVFPELQNGRRSPDEFLSKWTKLEKTLKMMCGNAYFSA
jgi:hypothetical protein